MWVADQRLQPTAGLVCLELNISHGARTKVCENRYNIVLSGYVVFHLSRNTGAVLAGLTAVPW